MHMQWALNTFPSKKKKTYGCSDHFLGLEDLAVALRAGVGVALLGLDDPRLDGRAGQHVVLLPVHLGYVGPARSKKSFK